MSDALLQLAGIAVAAAARGHSPTEIRIPVALEGSGPQGHFITLRGADGSLRGCRGEVTSSTPLAEALIASAYSTALDDPRFPALAPRELLGLSVGLSLLSPLRNLPLSDRSDLENQLDRDRPGLLLRSGSGSATFLPAVWDQFDRGADFLAALLHKAGWTDLPTDVRVWTYQATSSSMVLDGAALSAARS